MRKQVKPNFSIETSPQVVQKDIKVCPFCQQDPEDYMVGARPDRGEIGTWYVRCLTSGCAIQNHAILKRRWNQRT